MPDIQNAFLAQKFGPGTKLLVISDTHGILEGVKRAFAAEKDLCGVIHLGDAEGQQKVIRELAPCPVCFVRGNCDMWQDWPDELFFSLGKEKVLALHGHRQLVSHGLMDLSDYALGYGATLVLYGHTHIPAVDFVGDMRLLNPGSISKPRQAGNRPTYLVLTVKPSGKVDYGFRDLAR